tara:strand:+ start:4568 stop:5683 length:1116 start_codon:yes stop_codon:yes gene_type:complete
VKDIVDLIMEQLNPDERKELLKRYKEVGMDGKDGFSKKFRKLFRLYHPDRKQGPVALQASSELGRLNTALDNLSKNSPLTQDDVDALYLSFGREETEQLPGFVQALEDLEKRQAEEAAEREAMYQQYYAQQDQQQSDQQQGGQSQQQGGTLPEAYYNAAQMVLDSTEIISFLQNYSALTDYASQVGISSERTGSAKRFATSMIDEIQRLKGIHIVEVGMELMKIEKRLYEGEEDLYLLSNLDTNLDLRGRFIELMDMLLPEARNGYVGYVAAVFNDVQDMGTFVKEYRLLVPYDTRYTEDQKAILLNNFNTLMEVYKEAGRAHFRGPKQRELERLMDESTVTNMGTNGNVREAFDRIAEAAFRKYNPQGIR